MAAWLGAGGRRRSIAIAFIAGASASAALAPELFANLRNRTIMVVAGAPACMEELKAIGIQNFINVKTNLLEALTAYNKMLGI